MLMLWLFYPLLPSLVLGFQRCSATLKAYILPCIIVTALIILSPWVQYLPILYHYTNLATSSQAQTFSIMFNADKCFTALSLWPLVRYYQYHHPFVCTNQPRLSVFLATYGLFMILLVSIGLSLHFLRWDPTWPSLTAICLANNGLVCCCEEVIFRGVLQPVTQQLLPQRPWLMLSCSALIFGLVHQSFAMKILATVAGLCYGGIYFYSGRLSWAIALHFLINASHFFFFSYPRFIHS